MKITDNQFTVLTDQGEEVKCDVLFTFDSEENGRSYVVYTDNSVDADGNINVYASIYDPSSDSSALLPIETEEEWAMVRDILNKLQQEIAKRSDDE